MKNDLSNFFGKLKFPLDASHLNDFQIINDSEVDCREFYSYIRFYLLSSPSWVEIKIIFNNLQKMKLDNLMTALADAMISACLNFNKENVSNLHFSLVVHALKNKDKIIYDRTKRHVAQSGVYSIFGYWEKLYPYLKENKFKILLDILENKDFSYFVVEKMLDIISPNDKLEFWTLALTTSYGANIARILNSHDDLAEKLEEDIVNNSDESIIAKFFLDRKINPKIFNFNSIYEILSRNWKHMPKAAKESFDFAYERQHWWLLPSFHEAIDKRLILSRLLESNTEYLIQKFISDHKDDPVLEKILPYI